MSYNYMVKMQPTSEESIVAGAAFQNRSWMKKNYPYRVEYIGSSNNDTDGYTENLLVTGLFNNVNYLEDFKGILSDFLSQVEFGYNQDWERPFVSSYSVTSQQVKDLYKRMADKTDVDWSLDVDTLPPDEKEDFYKDIKQRYYEYNLEFLLYRGLRDRYMDYMNQTLPSPLSVQQKAALEENKNKVDAKGNVTGQYRKYVPMRMEGYEIIYGKYHISVCPSEAIIPPYGKNVPGIQTRISDFAFDGCDNLEDIKIWEQISHFGIFVFRNCTNLKEVELNNNMVVIPENNFLNCISLKKVTMPESIKVIAEHAFNNCQALEDDSLVAKTSLEVIGKSAFVNCSSLKTIILPETLTEIGDFAFSNSGLEQITLPYNVKSIGFAAFMECSRLKYARLSDNIKEVPSLCFKDCNELVDIILPRNVIKIGDSAFENCMKLESLVLPDGVKEIGDCAFKGCTELKRLVLPASIVFLGDCDFGENTIIYCKKNSYVHKVALMEEWNFQLIKY